MSSGEGRVTVATTAKRWGKKTGIAPLRCPPGDFPGVPELGIPAVTVEAVIHPLPAR